uniref:Uncharacterized protein n=1 Tax=Anguilla anguilla TaxID=7936 RepID=A0A0E9RTP1_ANGAN
MKSGTRGKEAGKKQTMKNVVPSDAIIIRWAGGK